MDDICPRGSEAVFCCCEQACVSDAVLSGLTLEGLFHMAASSCLCLLPPPPPIPPLPASFYPSIPPSSLLVPSFYSSHPPGSPGSLSLLSLFFFSFIHFLPILSFFLFFLNSSSLVLTLYRRLPVKRWGQHSGFTRLCLS